MNIKCVIDMLCILIFLTFGEFSLFFAKQDITGIAMLTRFQIAYISFLLNFITLFFVIFVENYDLFKLILFFKLRICYFNPDLIAQDNFVYYNIKIYRNIIPGQ